MHTPCVPCSLEALRPIVSVRSISWQQRKKCRVPTASYRFSRCMPGHRLSLSFYGHCWFCLPASRIVVAILSCAPSRVLKVIFLTLSN